MDKHLRWELDKIEARRRRFYRLGLYDGEEVNPYAESMREKAIKAGFKDAFIKVD